VATGRKAEGMLPNPRKIDPLSRRPWPACPVNLPVQNGAPPRTRTG